MVWRGSAGFVGGGRFRICGFVWTVAGLSCVEFARMRVCRAERRNFFDSVDTRGGSEVVDSFFLSPVN